MAQQFMLDTADQAVLDLLTWRCRAGTDEQIKDYLEALGFAGTKWRPKMKFASRTLVGRAEVVVCLPVIEGPLFSWCAGDRAPDCDALAWQLSRRLARAIPRPVTIYWATQRATHLVGGVTICLQKPLQLEHDLGVMAAYLKRLRLDPETLALWLGEDMLRAAYAPLFPRTLPDAALIGPDDTVYRLIEYGGRYNADRLRRFHRFCVKRFFDYEVW